MAGIKMDPTEKILLDPYIYICQIPGKKVRSQLALAFNHWLQIPTDKLHIIGEATQMLHNASLLIDDIEDSSTLRRGIPVAHNIYGVPHTINSANYVYFLGLQKVLDLQHKDATRVFTETGGLFGLAVRLMQLFTENTSDFKPLLDNLGLYFQIRDDYANLNSKEYAQNKSYCEDLTEGKFSFPLIHAIQSDRGDHQILSILRQRTQDNDVKKYCVDLLEKRGSFEYTKATLMQLEKEIYRQIEEFGGNAHLTGLIDELRKIYTS
ncbi:geranylgeranyl pyrophosphate synthase-like isoform X2 [Dreissena polymorpha]|uniref:geranylgeranyl pyrophosphate synthase-like isoform X2 n=1 Tax=Dreissena polymorpha TaxID=45954 RepID=UPI002263CE19|nr:geranylgeranyl pyrophosphate synthase-like isoform X2 [Dreissena polymorpha]